ncbi:YtfJ family protein [Vibrio sinensis]|uniref:YtfJ family protein n=1 Tax=Vibrio sinensis TaxID=2302434 RepID=A0A3A6QJB8_9VIBR|nr:YtfJ family protein [Vibrio sinensis]RJX65234.1 YtfJ family protein [Vibrio sinensis]
MKNKTLLALALTCSPMIAFAHNITIGQSLPAADVINYGEILVKGNDTVFQDWKTNNMLGKVRVIQAIAGRSSAKEMNAEMMSAITAEKFPADSYQTTTIINQDDAIWGTGSFVKSSAEDSKKDFPWSSMVLDENGVVAKTWDLQPESSTIIVQDKQGQVLFVKEGKMSDGEVIQVLELIKENL